MNGRQSVTRLLFNSVRPMSTNGQYSGKIKSRSNKVLTDVFHIENGLFRKFSVKKTKKSKEKHEETAQVR